MRIQVSIRAFFVLSTLTVLIVVLCRLAIPFITNPAQSLIAAAIGLAIGLVGAALIPDLARSFLPVALVLVFFFLTIVTFPGAQFAYLAGVAAGIAGQFFGVSLLNWLFAICGVMEVVDCPADRTETMQRVGELPEFGSFRGDFSAEPEDSAKKC